MHPDYTYVQFADLWNWTPEEVDRQDATTLRLMLQLKALETQVRKNKPPKQNG